MKPLSYPLAILLITCCSGLIHAQEFLNGSFENNTASNCQWNMTNAGFNSMMANCIAFGAKNEMDIQMVGCAYAAPVDSDYFISIHNENPGGPSDEVSMLLTSPLIAGNIYTISYYEKTDTTFDNLDSLQIGLSYNSNSFGSLIYTSQPPVSNWVQRVFTFTAPVTGSYIALKCKGDDEGWNFIDGFKMEAGFTYNNLCLGDSTQFTIPNSSSMFGAQWNFGDTASGVNNSSTLFSPTHVFSAPGTYMVEVIKYYATYNDTVVQPVTIYPLPAVSLGSDTTLCNGNSLLLNAGPGFLSYLWQDSSASSTFNIITAGTYYVTVTDSNCSATDSIVVDFIPCNMPQVNFASSDTSFCEKKCIDFFDLSTNNPTSWQWFFPGADSLTSNLQNPSNICYNNYGSFDVTLIACNATGCDTLVLQAFINEYAAPLVTITQSNDTLYASPGNSYQWWSVDSGMIPGATNSYFLYPYSGSYYVTITDSVGCIGTSNVIVISGIVSYADAAGPVLFPNPSNGTFQIKFNDAVGKDLSMQLYNSIGQQSAVKSTNALPGLIELDCGNLVDGIYYLKLTNSGNSYTYKLLVRKTD